MSAPSAPITLTLAADPPYGLIQSSRTLADGSVTIPATPGPDSDLQRPGAEERTEIRWASGFTIDPEPCGGGLIIDPCDDAGIEDDSSEPADIGPIQPFPIVASVECSTFGSSFRNREARVLRKLRAIRSFQLEREFWSGLFASAGGFTNNQWLTKTSGLTVINNNVPEGLRTAFADLEQAIADSSSWAPGMIHAMPRTVAHWYGMRLIEKQGNLLVSPLGTIVVPGRGYPGTGPGDTNLTTGLGGDVAWAYATSLVYTMLGPAQALADDDATTVDRSTNTRVVTAVQDAAYGWDGCVHAAVAVLHTQELSAVGS